MVYTCMLSRAKNRSTQTDIFCSRLPDLFHFLAETDTVIIPALRYVNATYSFSAPLNVRVTNLCRTDRQRDERADEQNP